MKLLRFIRNIINTENVVWYANIHEDFEEKIKQYSNSDGKSICEKFINAIKLNSEFKSVYRRYDINMRDKQVDVLLYLTIEHDKWSNTLEFNLHIKYSTAYEKIIYLKIDIETAKLISFDCSQTNILLIRIMFSMLLSEIDRLSADFNYKNKIIAKIIYKDDLPFTQDVSYVDEILI